MRTGESLRISGSEYLENKRVTVGIKSAIISIVAFVKA